MYPGELFYAFPLPFRGLAVTGGGLQDKDRHKIKEIFLPVVDQQFQEEFIAPLVEEITDYFTDEYFAIQRSLLYPNIAAYYGNIDVDQVMDRVKAILAFNRALQRIVINYISRQQDEGVSELDFDDLSAIERDMSRVNRNYDRLSRGSQNYTYIPMLPWER